MTKLSYRKKTTSGRMLGVCYILSTTRLSSEVVGLEGRQ